MSRENGLGSGSGWYSVCRSLGKLISYSSCTLCIYLFFSSIFYIYLFILIVFGFSFISFGQPMPTSSRKQSCKSHLYQITDHNIWNYYWRQDRIGQGDYLGKNNDHEQEKHL